MLILSQAKITIRNGSDLTIEGFLASHHAKISNAIMELGITKGTIRYRSGRYLFSASIDPERQQQLRNFLFNECP